MQRSRRLPFSLLILSLTLLLGILVTACGSPSASSNNQGGKQALISASIGLGYIPDVQFAPFYVAVNKGYYKAAGLDVTLHHGIVPDLMGEMISGKDTFVFAGGDDTLVARSKNMPVVDVSTIYRSYPVAVIVPASSSIKTLADLKGHSIGLPGMYGSTYVGLLALLNAVHLTANDVKLQSIGFTQVNALLRGSVDAVVGYTNNEPLQIERQGMKVRTFAVSDYQPMVSNGIVTTESTLRTKEQSIVQPFVKATLEGLSYVIAHPYDAVQISANFVPGIDIEKATADLLATIPDWKGGQPGYNDLQTWQQMMQFMAGAKLIPAGMDISKAFVNV